VTDVYRRYTLTFRDIPDTAEDGGALDDVHPEVVGLLRRLGIPGWQEEAGSIVFWLAAGSGLGQDAVRALRRTGALCVVDEEPGWEVRWREFHRPVAVGPFYVRPPWATPRPGLLDVCVEAGMAFGTGGHETTRQSLRALASVAPGSLLDVGTGTGVLAIAASRRGFSPVTAVDRDPVAVEAATVNGRLNDLDLDVRLADATDPATTLPPREVWIANLELAPILALAARLDPAGEGARGAGEGVLPRRLLLAGLLESHGTSVVDALGAYREARRDVAGEWLLLDLELAA
jgi:ribosomal protein L11 methyltransferase